MNARNILTFLILGGLAAGAVVGEIVHSTASPEAAARFARIADYIGADIFMGLLKMPIVPLIVSSVLVGVASAGDFSRLGKLAWRTFAYFFATMFAAVTLGMIVVSIVRPGDGFFSGTEGEAQRAAYPDLRHEGLEQDAMNRREGRFEVHDGPGGTGDQCRSEGISPEGVGFSPSRRRTLQLLQCHWEFLPGRRH